ncbi:MAG: histidinol dehydrogenase [Halodesulfurarchaeum sp.]
MEPEPLGDLGTGRRRSLFERDAGIEEIRSQVSDIVDQVREEGDAALREFSRRFDDVDVGNLDITDRAERAVEDLDDDVRTAIEDAAANIRAFHARQQPTDWRTTVDGRELGRRFRPIERAGVYVPGGRAAYPSSALMGVIPAAVAGVEHIVVTTPPAEELDPATLAALSVAGADAIYNVGGAQAVAAMAYGTESVEPVQKIVGPGNRWVTAAKEVVQEEVAIDFLAGPSEVLVVADSTARPAFVAADLLAQAEHDPDASVVAVTPSETVARETAEEVRSQLAGRERREVIEEALARDASGIFWTRSMSEAVLFAEEYAPEHLSIQAADDEAVLDRIDSAGSVFLGPYTPVAAGDYATGTNHVLPTGAAAKVVGGLSVDTFMRASTVQRLEREALGDLRETVTRLARTEGLEAHAESVDVRFADE